MTFLPHPLCAGRREQLICLRILFFFLLPWLLCATHPITFQIKGIEGALLNNVQHRLNELIQNNRIKHISADVLREQVEQALYPFGYFKPEILIQDHRANQPWSIIIHPGPILRIRQFTFTVMGEGKTDSHIEQARKQSLVYTGSPFNTLDYETTKTNALNAAEGQGYIHAAFEKSEVIIDKVKYTADITLILNTGPRFYFGRIQFSDKNYLSEDFLYRYVPFKYGEPFSNEQLQTLNNHLAASGYFKSAEIKPAEAGTNHIPLVANLEPVDRLNYTVGVGYGTDTGARGRVGLHVNPVNSHGDQFNAMAQGSVSQNALQMQYLIPGQDPVHDHVSLNGGFTNLNYTSGSSNGVLASIAQLHVSDKFQSNFSLNGLHERFTYTGQIRTEKNLLYPKGEITWRQVSDELFSPTGYNITINAFAATQSILSDVSVASASVDAKAALTIDAIRARIYLHGMQGITGIGDVYNLPLSLALLLGGAENMKGYSYNSMGPGKLLTYGGAELQKETFERWYAVGFVDAGHVYRPSQQPFQYDVGGGLMWRSPVGPIKVVAAKPLNADGVRLVINMGPDL